MLDPNSHTSGEPGIAGDTRILLKGWPRGKSSSRNASSSASCSGKSSDMGVFRSRRKARRFQRPILSRRASDAKVYPSRVQRVQGARSSATFNGL